MDEIFTHFEHEPVAAASIAQVRTAELADGRKVIVKVRRASTPKRKLIVMTSCVSLSQATPTSPPTATVMNSQVRRL